VNHILRIGGSIAALALVALLLGLAGPAAAFQQADQNRNYEIRLPEFDLEGYQSPATAEGSLQVANILNGRYSGNWRVQSWNPQTAGARWIYGTSVKVAESFYTSEDVERAARQVIAANEDVLRADASQLRLTDTPNAAGKWAAHFQQTWHGVDVYGATVRLVFSEDGRLMLMGSDYQPNINLSPVPLYSDAQAIQIAKNGVNFNEATDTIQDAAKLLVLPVSLSQTEVAYHLVWRVRVRTEDPVGIWVTHVDAHTGQVIWRYNDVHFAYSGTSSAPVQLNSYCDGTVIRPAQYLRVQVSGVGNVNTDINGNWSINGTGGPRSVTADLYGPYVDLNNIAGAEATFTGTAQENVPLDVAFTDLNAQKDERDTFDAVNQIHDFFEEFAPGFSYTNTRINANVSRNSTCNAYWDGTINFYIQGGGCANTGEMQQVVEHEFGHGVQNAIIGGQGNQGLGEGNGDILGNLMTQDPIIGRGFYLNNCTSGIRNSLNTLRYPGDVIGQEIHYAGQVIAGFNWDMMVGLQAQYGTHPGTIKAATLWHNGRVLLHPQTQPDQVLSAFTADDDNGNLDDGTPNYDAICLAATNHGFTCPEIIVGVFITHTALPYSGDRTLGYPLTATMISLPAGQAVIVPSSAFLHYRVNGGIYQNLAMAPTGNQDEYGVTIPAQEYGSIVEYYLSAQDTDNNTGTSPRDYPASLHYFQVNNTFADAMETVTAWKAGYTGDNASAGLWIEADPIGSTFGGNPVQPEDDHTADPGHICWITGNGSVGGQGGEADVDGGKTTLLSPRFDLTGATQVQVDYWKFYTNDRGNSPGLDYWYVDVTNDGGQTWTPMEHTTTSTNAWAPMSFDLLQFVPTPGVVQFRFIAEDITPGSLVEGGVDDFLLAAVFPTMDAGDFSVRLVTRLQQNTPNPFGPTTDIRFRLAQEGTVSLAVYDGTGRRVRNLASGSLNAGDHNVRWDGTDDSGRAVAAGIYFCRLESEGKTHSARMLLIK
jgi:Zn-dependent metalloprotease